MVSLLSVVTVIISSVVAYSEAMPMKIHQHLAEIETTVELLTFYTAMNHAYTASNE